jgi:hypothetical protein
VLRALGCVTRERPAALVRSIQLRGMRAQVWSRDRCRDR